MSIPRPTAHNSGGRLTIPVTASALAALLTVALVSNPRPALVALALSATAAQVIVLRRVTRQALPLAAILLVALNVVGTFGYFYYRKLNGAATVSYQVPDSPEIYHSAAIVFAVASLCLFVGAVVASVGTRPQPATTHSNEILRRPVPAVGILLCGLPIVLAVVGYGPGYLLTRPHYLDLAGPKIAVSAASLLMPASVAVLSAAITNPGQRAAKPVAALLWLVSFTVVFAEGTRQIAMFPALIFVGYLSSRGREGRSTRTILLGLATVATAAVALDVIVSLRSTADGAGLRPFLHVLTSQPSLAFSGSVLGLSGNVLFAVPLTGTVVTLIAHLPAHALPVSLNPLPGHFTNWNTFHLNLQLNQVTPYNGLGELTNEGWWSLVGYLLTVSAVLTGLQRWNRRLPTMSVAVGSLIGYGMTGLLALDLLQYNLRTGTRLVWYYIAVSVALHAIAARRPVAPITRQR